MEKRRGGEERKPEGETAPPQRGAGEDQNLEGGKNYVWFAVSALHAVSARTHPQEAGVVPAFCVQNGGLCSEVVSISLGRNCAHKEPWAFHLPGSAIFVGLAGHFQGTLAPWWGLGDTRYHAGDWSRLGLPPAPLASDAGWVPRPTLGLIVTLPGPVRTATYVGACSAEVTSPVLP